MYFTICCFSIVYKSCDLILNSVMIFMLFFASQLKKYLYLLEVFGLYFNTSKRLNLFANTLNLIAWVY